VVITYSRLTGLIYVGVSMGKRTHISEFATMAKGDGTIYVMAHSSSTGSGSARVFAFSRHARGDAAPLRTFADRRSHFANAQGIAVNGCLRLFQRLAGDSGRLTAADEPRGHGSDQRHADDQQTDVAPRHVAEGRREVSV